MEGAHEEPVPLQNLVVHDKTYGVVITIGVLIGDQSLTATTATISTVAQINKIMDIVHSV